MNRLGSLVGAPRETHIRMADIATTPERHGLVPLSPATIRRKIADGTFPRPRRYPGMAASFFVYGEILDWLEAQTRSASEGMMQ